MITIHQGDFTVRIHPLKIGRFIQDLGLAKRRPTQPEKIQIDELSYQPQKLYTEALLEFFEQSHCRGNQCSLNPLVPDVHKKVTHT